MKKWYVLLFPLLMAMVVSGQTLTVSTIQLNFGTVFENNPDSLPLTVHNNIGKPVNVTDIQFFNIYGTPAFSASQSNFAIANGASQLIWVKFAPLHNIYHNTEMVIINDGLRGAVSVDLLAQGSYSMTYYNATENLAEEALKTAINNVTGQGYVSLGYGTGRDSMFMSIDNKRVNGQGATQNTIECVYTGRLAVGYIDKSDAFNNYQINTEHTWPQGLFSSLEPMRSDLHHLFPTDEIANNTRASYPFGVVTNATWTNGGSKFDNNNNIFEPRDLHKGAAARAMMYFVLRYQNYSNFMDSQESILRTWHYTYPPGIIENKRNDDIALSQHNRNPFVDYPQFVDRIHSFSTISVAPAEYSFKIYSNTIDYGVIAPVSLHIYSFVIVNDGNQPLQLSNFQLSDPGLLAFTSGGTNYTLAPGEALLTEINIFPITTGSINETLSFNTNNPSSPTVQVPITAISGAAGIAETGGASLAIMPNPATDYINIYCPQDQGKLIFKLTNELGQPVQCEAVKNNDSYSINLSRLKSGFYILSATANNGYIYKQKFIKQE